MVNAHEDRIVLLSGSAFEREPYGFSHAIYGIEQALLSATVEYGIDRAKRIPAYWLNGYTRIARGRGLGCSFLGR
jgi:hypothetical protein